MPKEKSPKDAAQVLKSILSEKSAPQSLLVLCPDRVRRERIVESILEKFCPAYSKNTRTSESFSHVNSENLNSGNIQGLLDNINSLSLFAPRKFILISRAEELNASLYNKILEALKQNNPNTNIIITAQKLPANSQLYTFFKMSGSLIELQELKNLDLTRWVHKELKSSEIEISEEALPEAIIQSCDADPDKISELISRLALFLDGEKASLQSLRAISSYAADASEFALIDNLPNKRASWKSELLIHQIFKSGKSPFALLGLISRTYNNYLKMAYLREKGLNPQQIRQRLNISPWVFNKQFELSKSYNVGRLQKSLESILLADSKLKNRSLGDEAIFSELIQSL